MSDQNRIKQKILSINPQRWWGDDFDVRFYLISRLKKIKRKSILDVGGGIGIVSSEMDQSNFRVNLDSSFEDLKTCGKMEKNNIHNIQASMTNLPFKEKTFDVVICCNLLEVAKSEDIKRNQFSKNESICSYPTIEKVLSEISRAMKQVGSLYLTTPNNAYYKTKKLTFGELKNALKKCLKNSEILFYNTHTKIGKNRKMNMANIIPKFMSRISNPDKIIINLAKKESSNNYSVSFFVEAKNS